jgi:hypothetical protein
VKTALNVLQVAAMKRPSGAALIFAMGVCFPFGVIVSRIPYVGDQLDPPALRTAAEVDDAIFRLQEEATRLVALEQLATFGSFKIYRVGSVFFLSTDPDINTLADKAASALAKYCEFETVRSALNSQRHHLQFWALWHIPSPLFQENLEESWRTLLPRMRELATRADAHIRGRAQQRLLYWPGQRPFLARCAETETCLSNIMELVYDADQSEFHRRMHFHVRRLLADPDEAVRHDALLHIESTSHMAPMWQIPYPDDVFRRVLELSHSSSAKERAAAVSVLTDLRKQHPNIVRERMKELAFDPSEDVRWRIIYALADQLDDPRVKPVLQQLLRDSSDEVRYFTILKLGPGNYVPELRAIAARYHPKAAEWAAETLDGLAHKRN